MSSSAQRGAGELKDRIPRQIPFVRSLYLTVLSVDNPYRCRSRNPSGEEKVSAPSKGAVAAVSENKDPSKVKTIDNINQESEKSTLGDIEALRALKEKMSAPKEVE